MLVARGVIYTHSVEAYTHASLTAHENKGHSSKGREEKINNFKSQTNLHFQWERRQIDGHGMINKRCTLAFPSFSWQFYLSLSRR